MPHDSDQKKFQAEFSAKEYLQNYYAKIIKIEHCDIFQKDLGITKESFDVINIHFMVESATSSKDSGKPL